MVNGLCRRRHPSTVPASSRRGASRVATAAGSVTRRRRARETTSILDWRRRRLHVDERQLLNDSNRAAAAMLSCRQRLWQSGLAGQSADVAGAAVAQHRSRSLTSRRYDVTRMLIIVETPTSFDFSRRRRRRRNIVRFTFKGQWLTLI